MTLDRSILRQLGAGRRTVVVTGTNGKSTTTRMTAAALAAPWDRWPPTPRAPTWTPAWWRRWPRTATRTLAALEVDEMHVPHVLDAIERCGRHLAQSVARPAGPGRRDQRHRTHAARWGWPAPQAVVVANCDDVLMTSAAYDSPARGVGGRGRRVGERLGELSAQRRGHRPRQGPLVQHRHRLQATHTAVVVRRRKMGAPSTGPTGWPCRCGWRCPAR
jgi:hypothetical protein